MESCKVKYLSVCKEQKINPSDGIMHVFRESTKLNHVKGGGELILNFSGCNLSVGDCQVLSKCFATDGNIEEYRFTDCLLCEDACKIILNAFTFNKAVTILDLKGNNLRGSGAELIGKLLKRTTTLRELYLEWNTLGMWDDGIGAISEGLSMNQSLRVLDLSNNQISHEGGQEIASSLKRNKYLRTLDLRWNNVGVLGGRAFLAALGHNKYIINLLLAGNNIPSDTMKAIATSVQRNIDYHTIYEEHHSMTRSLKDEIDHLQLEKSLQVSTLVGQLEKEKELHDNLTETTHDRLKQMKIAIEELKKENKNIRERNEELVNELKSKSNKTTELNSKIEQQQVAEKNLEEKHSTEMIEITDILKSERKQKQQEELEKENHIFELQKNIKILKERMEEYVNERNSYRNVIKTKQTEHDSHIVDLKNKHSMERDELKSDSNDHIKSLNEKLSRHVQEKERLEEEVSRLKSNSMTDKLRYDEDVINQRARWKQEEMLKSKQYEDRIDLLIGTKDELQTKISKLSIQVSESNAQLISATKELESYKRQTEQQQQVINQKDLEYRNETNRLRLEVDNEKRNSNELKDRIMKLESQNQELNSQLRELKSLKDSEISNLQASIKSKEDDMKRIRDEELRRSGMLETALQSYVASARSAYK